MTTDEYRKLKEALARIDPETLVPFITDLVVRLILRTSSPGVKPVATK